ncbi:MAG TPA: PAS domain-containing protein [Ignavibacteriaceae bacterium]|nr:PAS domain-containing protein [Ignavibacteriaceae bacterium]
MEDKSLHIGILKPVLESFTVPALVYDEHGDILIFNSAAESLLNASLERKNLFEILPVELKSFFERISEQKEKQSLTITDILEMQLKSGKVKCEIVTKPLSFIEKSYFLLTINLNYCKSEKGNKLIYCSPEKLKKVLSNDVIAIIDEIKNSFPFTFIGKEKIQNMVNKIPEMFWIKEPDDKFILVNDKLAGMYKLKPQQVEGKSEEYFLPYYLLEFNQTISSYIKNTLNCFITEGIQLKGFSTSENYLTIEIPLIDSENQLQAVIGIAQTMKSDLSGSSLNTYQSFDIPLAYLFFNEKGEITNYNKKMFGELGIEKDLFGTKYFDVFEQVTSKEISKVLDSGELQMELTGKIKSNHEIENYTIKIVKIVGDYNENINYFLTLEKQKEVDDIEELIKKRGKMFDVLIKKNPDPIFIYDLENLRFLEANEAALNLYGFSRDEFLKMDLTDLYAPEDIQTLLENNSFEGDDKTFNGPYKHKRKDGSIVYVEIYKNPFKFHEREAHFNIIRNVSSDIEKEKNLQLYKSIFDNTDNMVFTTDDVGFIQYINLPVSTYLNYIPDDLQNSSFISLLEETDRIRINSLVFNSKLNDAFNATINLKKKDGSFLKCAVTISPVIDFNGELISYSVIGKPEEHVIEKIVEVKTEVEKPVVKQADDYINPQVLTTIFHEILTPINVILGFVQELKDSVDNPNEEQVEALKYITENRIQLLDVMNSVAEYSQVNIEAGKIKVTESNFAEIVETVNKELKDNTGILKEKEFLYGKLSWSLEVKTDILMLKTFLYVLSRMCFKISQKKELYISGYQYDEDNFLVSFKDDEAEISDKLLKTLDLVFKSKDVSFIREFGLSRYSVLVAKKIFEILQGKLELVKKSGKDSEFGFIFPIILRVDTSESVVEESEEPVLIEKKITHEEAPAMIPEAVTTDSVEIPKIDWNSKKNEHKVTEVKEPVVVQAKTTDVVELETAKPEEQPLQQKPKELEISRLSCLYIEDQVDSQILFKVQMKELKDMKFAVSFEEALPLITSNQFDFIVMDINLQGEYNGLDALKMIRQMPVYAKLPIIAVTAYVLPGDKEKFVAAGFNDFISKPIFREKMIESLEKIFT